MSSPIDLPTLRRMEATCPCGKTAPYLTFQYLLGDLPEGWVLRYGYDPSARRVRKATAPAGVLPVELYCSEACAAKYCSTDNPNARSLEPADLMLPCGMHDPPVRRRRCRNVGSMALYRFDASADWCVRPSTGWFLAASLPFHNQSFYCSERCAREALKHWTAFSRSIHHRSTPPKGSP